MTTLLTLVDEAYKNEAPDALPAQQLNDMIAYLGQLLDGGHLQESQIAQIQQLGLKALNLLQHE